MISVDEKVELLEFKLQEAEEKIRSQKDTIRDLELYKIQLGSIMENMTEFVECTDADYRLTYVNKSLADFYGKTQAELLGSDTMALVIPEDHKKIHEMMKYVDADHPHYKYEYRINIDGKIYWMESVGRGFYDNEGKIIEYQDVGRDITHFKDQEEELKIAVAKQTRKLQEQNEQLQELNNYLQSILSCISEGIVIIDKDGNCEFLNYGPNHMWKKSEKDIKAFFVNTLNDKKSNELNWMFLKKRGFMDHEMSFSSASGGDVSFFVSGVPLEVDSDIVEKGILVLKPITQVHKMVARMSGNQAHFHFKDIVSNNNSLKDVITIARQAAVSDCNVMIEGESGTGKELFAQSIHNASPRKNGPFVAVNCGAIPRDLVASELFGYVEGAFTGAKKGGKPGKFELANGGTIFLDEIGDMPLEQQITLLRVIQERCVSRIGGNKVIPVDVRIICATNRDLQKEAMENNFREDLLYRLNVIGLKIPPLRERKDDILPLFCNFWVKTGGKAEDFLGILQPDVVEILMNYNWPGNVRELENAAERMLNLSGGKEISVQYLPTHIAEFSDIDIKEEKINHGVKRKYQPELSLTEIRKKAKYEAGKERKGQLAEALEAENGNIAAAARRLGISRATFYRKMKDEKLM